MRPSVRAVADIGSNSARLLVVRPTDQGHLDVLSDARVALRLARAFDSTGRLTKTAARLTAETLGAFRIIARRHGARRLSAVATAAVREATNSDQFVAEVATRSGCPLRVLTGDDEARLALVGAISALPVEDGMVVDLGGGSAELAAFARRRHRSVASLPLGALRLTVNHLERDPPRAEDIEALRSHIREQLQPCSHRLDIGEGRLVGTGGTVRALAKAARSGNPAIARLHGQELHRETVRSLVTRLARLPRERRNSVPGISVARAESILAGAVVLETLLDEMGLDRLVVSAYGVRQGVLLEEMGMAVQRPGAVRDASVSALLGRVRERAREPQRRRLVTGALATALAPTLEELLLELCGHAARLVDAGAHLDHYGRWKEAAALTTTADLDGFTHAELATIAAMLLVAGGEPVPAAVRRASGADRTDLERAGALLALADDIDHRLPVGGTVSIGGLRSGGRLTVEGMATMAVPADLSKHCRRALGCELRVFDGGPSTRERAAPGIAVEFK